MSNDLFKRNCAVLAQWYAGECKEVMEIKSGNEWVHCVATGPVLPVGYELRIKPRTIAVNGIEVPEPVREPLKDGDVYWATCFGEPSLTTVLAWAGDGIDLLYLDLGLIHMTKEAAQQHAEAMLAPSKRAES